MTRASRGRIARVRDHARQPLGDPEPALGLGQKHHTTVRGQAPAIEGGSDLLAGHGWKRERRSVSSVMAGVAALRCRQVSATKSYAASSAYATLGVKSDKAYAGW